MRQFKRHDMGPVLPPQRKGRVPQYSRNRLEDLQQKCDELEAMGVPAKPEDLGVTVEYLNPSFLVKKPSGDFRLVTAFSEVAKYAKPQPSLMPNVDNTLVKSPDGNTSSNLTYRRHFTKYRCLRSQ